MISLKLSIVLTVLVFVMPDVCACSCQHVGIIENKRQADYVFKGTVTDVNESNYTSNVSAGNVQIEYTRTEYTFKITTHYKGLTEQKVVVLLQGMTDCNFTFKKGKSYLVYAYSDNSELHYRLADQKTEPYTTTNLCTRTKRNNVLAIWENLVLWLT